ncbi:hypothetical protein HCU01_37990 [Halomonas cupida]|uniref:Uncharacterized protein n=1 Tax=Halomonas cupida TaxID=44933 RepID=A0ABQ0WJA6_9GAMM|nr:hypothetical protein HCU01_37990 [Halomonas cupida]
MEGLDKDDTNVGEHEDIVVGEMVVGRHCNLTSREVRATSGELLGANLMATCLSSGFKLERSVLEARVSKLNHPQTKTPPGKSRRGYAARRAGG